MSPLKYLQSTAKTSAALILTTGILLSANQAYAADVAQTPLLLGGGNVPGNLALVPSVEFPTVISVANIARDYSPTTVFAGYFDSGKCYAYSYNATESLRHFYPTRFSSSRECTVANEWSGNFLNWAATQTIDPFRSVLTGGYRVVDTATETQLEKARHPMYGSTGNFPNRRIPFGSGNNLDLVQGATPFSASNMRMRVAGLNNQMAFQLDRNDNNQNSNTTQNPSFLYNTPTTTSTAYDPNIALIAGTDYLISIRVKVCVSGLEETNCKRYGTNSKPEGLIQEYSKDIRYSAFSYLADDSLKRDGGVLRANQKYVGPTLQNGGTNSANEWSQTTGVLITNPNPTDATATGVTNSGVINYINKFGQNTNNLKTFDPVSELYYTATRYFKNLGNVPAYSNYSGTQHDFFPVITNWNDPVQYSCQKNVILGIGDTNTHADRNVPGGTTSTNEPATPAEVSADTTVNATTATLRVGALEGVGSLNADTATGLGCCNINSAYIAGIAYDSNTKDIRPSIAGKQTISTHWVDVQENSTLRTRATNQYWLAAKYGGFKVPTNYGDPYTGTVAIPESAWWTNGETQTNGDKRPDNFYIASDATKMVESLKLAFRNIANEVQSTTASLATNSTRLGTDTAVYQSLLDSRDWSGDLIALSVSTTGAVNSTPAWRAAAKMDALTASEITARKIFTNTTPTGTTGGPFISTSGRDFSWSGLDTLQKTLLTEDQLNFVRGDRTKEQTVDDKTKPFRKRGSRFGDIVNSDPQFIHTQNFGYSRLTWNKGTIVGGVADDYVAYRASSSYKTKKPLVIVGANDGMLHGFDANINTTGGTEVFAYVPSSVMANLNKLSDPQYTHRYYVDATPRVGDYWTGSAWKTMAVGATGAGGKSVFALDITNPSSMSSSSVLWEFTHPRLGFTLGQPTLVALPNEKFGVIISSGAHETAPADGKVWILDANNGNILKEFTLPTTGDLGSVLASDTDYDFVADRLYVGDTLGNVWRLDMSLKNGALEVAPPSGLKQGTTTKPLLIVKDASGNRQPITAPLATAFDNNVHMVYFGTGSFYKVGDNEIPTNPPAQTFYGIADEGLQIDGRTNLLQQKITLEATLANGNTARQVSANVKSISQKGWYVDLAWQTAEGGPGPKGERVVARATLRNDRVIFTTLTPAADPCAFGGSSFIMSLSRATGARLTYAFFDTDGNQLIDDNDSLLSAGNRIPWSGLSDPDQGAIKGIVSLYRWICFAGSSGNSPKCVPVSGSQTDGRKSWREIRPN